MAKSTIVIHPSKDNNGTWPKGEPESVRIAADKKRGK